MCNVPVHNLFFQVLLHPKQQMHLVPTDFSGTTTSNTPDAPSTDRYLFDGFKQTFTIPKS